MSEFAERVLAEFYNLCGDILCGKADKNEIKRITKAMCEAGQYDIMQKEFRQMGNQLAKANAV